MQCFPYIDYSSESNSITSSEEFPTEPSFSVKLIPGSSESSYETTPLCKTRIKKINPNALARERGYNIIENPLFTQTIEVEECENVGGACSYVSNVRSVCRQRYMSIKLRVITKEKKTSYENFDIPSVCECVFLSSSRNRDLPF